MKYHYYIDTKTAYWEIFKIFLNQNLKHCFAKGKLDFDLTDTQVNNKLDVIYFDTQIATNNFVENLDDSIEEGFLDCESLGMSPVLHKKIYNELRKKKSS